MTGVSCDHSQTSTHSCDTGWITISETGLYWLKTKMLWFNFHLKMLETARLRLFLSTGFFLAPGLRFRGVKQCDCNEVIPSNRKYYINAVWVSNLVHLKAMWKMRILAPSCFLSSSFFFLFFAYLPHLYVSDQTKSNINQK